MVIVYFIVYPIKYMLHRQKCVEYIESEYEYFSAYIPNGFDIVHV